MAFVNTILAAANSNSAMQHSILLAQDAGGRTPLMQAVCEGKNGCAKAILCKSTDWEPLGELTVLMLLVADTEGNNVLMAAVSRNNKELVQLIVDSIQGDKRRLLDAENTEHSHAFHMATVSYFERNPAAQRDDIIEILLDRRKNTLFEKCKMPLVWIPCPPIGYDPKKGDINSRWHALLRWDTPVERYDEKVRACRNVEDAKRELLVTTPDDNKLTPLHLTALWGKEERAKTLLQLPLCKKGDEHALRIAMLLLTTRDGNGMVPLHWAAEYAQLEVVSKLPRVAAGGEVCHFESSV